VRRSRIAVALLATLAVVVGFSGGPALAIELRLVPDSSRVEYHITHSISDVTDVAGRASGRVQIDASNTSVQAAAVEVDLRALQTGISKRDAHIKSEEYLNVARFPTATFAFASAAPDAATPGTVRVHGKLGLHGVEREVEIPLVLEPRGDNLRVRGKFTIAFADHGIKRPKKLMFATGKTVDVRVDLLFSP